MEPLTSSAPPAAPIPASPPAATARPADPLWPTVLRVAWLSIGLGLAIEVLLLLLAAYSGTAGDGPKPFVADLAQKISWSFLVCVGIAFGSTASKAREGIMGVLGLISAPVAFTVARSVHKGVGQALAVAGPAMPGNLVLLVAVVKGLEYAVLGALLGWIGKKAWGLGRHVGAGAAVGLTFGSALVALLVRASPTPIPLTGLLSRGINEVIFPIGCALVLYSAGVLGKRLPGR
jgi:hypothetical protein